MSDVPAGKMRLFTLIRPVWRPGNHTLWLDQTVTEPGDATPLIKTAGGSNTDFAFHVTGPRITLPPAEILGCFPAPNAPEASDTSLPHIVLRRRTLPWERVLTSKKVDQSLWPPADTPWLALLLFPAKAAKLEAGPLSLAYTAQELSALGLDGATVCDQVVTSRAWLRAVMPRKQDLKLLTHARQLSLTDREAKDDDDGFMALVLANRLPTPATDHLACLVSLEGRWDDDIWPGPIQLQPASAIADGGDVQAVSKSFSPGAVYEASMSAAIVSGEAGSGGTDYQGGGQDPIPIPIPIPLPMPWEEMIQDRLVVLHSWTFHAGEGGDFEALMKKIGAAGVQRFAADQPEQAGFVALERRTTTGETETAFYRGPLVPVALARDAGIATSADSALEQESEGSPMVSNAAAFEIGRLLSLSSDAAMNALQSWRGKAQSLKAGNFLVEDHFKPLAQKILPFMPVSPEEIFTSMWQGPPALDQKQLETFAGDPSGIAHLMETIPGLTWSILSQYKPEMLAVDFTSVRSIDAHAALGGLPGQGNVGYVPSFDLGSMPIMDPGLGAALDVGFHPLVNLAVEAESP